MRLSILLFASVLDPSPLLHLIIIVLILILSGVSSSYISHRIQLPSPSQVRQVATSVCGSTSLSRKRLDRLCMSQIQIQFGSARESWK
ncbi:hypothetical protein LZ32DRAFT_601394 [Colletotrichum eremochloae]|nr:hypothetical protein LZ32DRAFT_601394 [Colletotrichum eremochloae]